MWRLLACVVALGWAAPAFAQGFDAQSYAPAAGRLRGFTIEQPTLPPHATLVLGGDLSYARRPLIIDRCGVDVCAGGTGLDGAAAVADLASLHASIAFALFERAQLGAVMPLSWASGDPTNAGQTSDSFAAGDLALSSLFTLVPGSPALALTVVATLPTGDEQRLVGADGPTLTPALIAGLDVGRAQLGARLGYRMRQGARVLGLEQDDELDVRLSAAVPVAGELAALVELAWRLGIGGERADENESPFEGRLGARLRLDSVAFVLGVGAALPPGRSGYGAPSVRAILGVRGELGFGDASAPVMDDVDHDGDGLTGASDRCPHRAEDRDGFLDDDGCPDVDDDADGLRDAVDRCPRRSEDADGFEDDDGCPELDDDGDGVADGRDLCVREPEDRDGVDDADGCPEPE